MLLLKTSIICLLFIIYMVGFYYRKPHIPIRSTRIFQVLTGVALLNAVFDLITVYTVNHRDRIPDWVNLIAHIIYLLSILGFIYLLFLYMRSYLETKLQFGRTLKICQSIPVVVSAAGILVLPITYIQGTSTAYSLGPKAYALYGSVVIYLILILYYCVRYWDILDGEKRMAIILAVPIYVVTSAIQMLMPEVLLAIVCSTLIMLGLILSNENTEKYVDEKTALFNQYSFETVLRESDFEKQRMIVAVLCFYKTENNFDWKQDIQILQDIHRAMKTYRMQGYRVCENGVAFVCNAGERAHTVLDKVKSTVQEKYGTDSVCIEAKVLSKEESATRHDCMRNVIAFCTETGSRFAYIDYMTHIYNRNALERDLERLPEHPKGYYMIADLNDLKLVNDTVGHSAGDEMLQGFAALLAGAVGENGKAYRQGGDEFAVLYEKDAEAFLQELAEQCRLYNRSSSVPISYAIGYCALDDKDFINAADRMMYENKKMIKQQRKQME
ncbi:MAG: GGDEF domain-containing protein [bacterium]|nr:GGDEF domain-containing protein [bacterium]